MGQADNRDLAVRLSFEQLIQDTLKRTSSIFLLTKRPFDVRSDNCSNDRADCVLRKKGIAMGTISAISYAVRTATATSNVPVKLSHAQQLVAAALGYRSLASYQAASEDAALVAASHIVIDSNLLEQRAIELGILLTSGHLVGLIGTAIKACHSAAQVHDSIDDFGDMLCSEAERAAPEDDDVCSAMAMCNHDGVREVVIPVNAYDLFDSAPVGEYYVTQIKGTVTLAIDGERPYSGHIIRVEADLSITRLGCRCFDEPHIDVTFAQEGGFYDDDEPEPISLAQALANHTGLDLATATEIADVDPVTNASEDGLIYGYFFYCKGQLSPEAEKAVLEHYPDLAIEVPPWVMDSVSAMTM